MSASSISHRYAGLAVATVAGLYLALEAQVPIVVRRSVTPLGWPCAWWRPTFGTPTDPLSREWTGIEVTSQAGLVTDVACAVPLLGLVYWCTKQALNHCDAHRWRRVLLPIGSGITVAICFIHAQRAQLPSLDVDALRGRSPLDCEPSGWPAMWTCYIYLRLGFEQRDSVAGILSNALVGAIMAEGAMATVRAAAKAIGERRAQYGVADLLRAVAFVALFAALMRYNVRYTSFSDVFPVLTHDVTKQGEVVVGLVGMERFGGTTRAVLIAAMAAGGFCWATRSRILAKPLVEQVLTDWRAGVRTQRTRLPP